MFSFKRISSRVNAVSMVMNDPARKPFCTMLVEIIQLWLRDRAKPRHYYFNLLYRKDFEHDIYAYVGERRLLGLRDRVNDPFWAPVLDNKVLFDLFFRETDIRLPKLVGYNIRNQFFIGDNVMRVSDCQQLATALELLADASPTASVFAKPVGGMQGRGCLLFDVSDVSRICADKGLELLNRDYVYQGVIVQHPKMAELHPSSVNTLRIDTYRTDQGKASVMSAFARIGVNKNIIDNASAGGCFVGVDLQRGTLMRNGFTMPEHGSSILDRHPDTGVLFDGFEVPLFCDAVSIAKRASELIPLTVVGWDVAISDNGPVLIEGNPNYHIGVSERAYGGYWRNPVFRRLVEDHAPELGRIGRQFDKAYPGEVGQVTDG